MARGQPHVPSHRRRSRECCVAGGSSAFSLSRSEVLPPHAALSPCFSCTSHSCLGPYTPLARRGGSPAAKHAGRRSRRPPSLYCPPSPPDKMQQTERTREGPNAAKRSGLTDPPLLRGRDSTFLALLLGAGRSVHGSAPCSPLTPRALPSPSRLWLLRPPGLSASDLCSPSPFCPVSVTLAGPFPVPPRHRVGLPASVTL